MTIETDHIDIKYLPAIGVDDETGQADYFWSDSTRDLSTIDTVIIHSMFNPDAKQDEQFLAQKCLELLVSYGVSAHYIIDRMGNIYQLVDELRMAWHAGKSKMPSPDDRESVNKFSVGIELLGNETDGFTIEQYNALASLITNMIGRLPIANILGHNHIGGAKVRLEDPKTDPWNFDWLLFQALLIEKIGSEKIDQMKLLGTND